MILEEAYRLVTVRDGHDEIEPPANRALFHAPAAIALKGSGIAMRRWKQIVERAELKQKMDHQSEVVFDGRMGKGVVRVLPGDGKWGG